jgi:hypothetical protein
MPAKTAKQGADVTQPRGGLIVVCGPPFGGKSLIGTRLAECLPHSIRLEAEDNLMRAGEVWYPDDRERRPVRNPQSKMLEAARGHWKHATVAQRPNVIVVARFATPAARLRAYKFALAENVKFLVIQANSKNLRAMRGLSEMLLPPDKAAKRVAQLQKAIDGYRPLTKDELRRFACLRLKGNLRALDDLFARVVEKWLI